MLSKGEIGTNRNWVSQRLARSSTFYPLPGKDTCPLQVTSQQFAGSHLFTWVEKGIVILVFFPRTITILMFGLEEGAW